MNNIIPLETTPRVYYEYYRTAINFDLYPSLSRRIGNGETLLRPQLRKLQQTNFISLGNSSPRHLYDEELDPLWGPRREPQPVLWDLYPAVLRNVENFGTEQMRQRLRIIMNRVVA